MKARAKIWPWLSYMRHIRSTADCTVGATSERLQTFATGNREKRVLSGAPSRRLTFRDSGFQFGVKILRCGDLRRAEPRRVLLIEVFDQLDPIRVTRAVQRLVVERVLHTAEGGGSNLHASGRFKLRRLFENGLSHPTRPECPAFWGANTPPHMPLEVVGAPLELAIRTYTPFWKRG